MRVLLLHPEDSPASGPWSRQRWDLIVDLGKSSEFSEERWSRQYSCPILRSDIFNQGIADTQRVREIFSAGSGRLVDEEGIDWWDLTNVRLAPEALATLALHRVAAEIDAQAELWSTRASWQSNILASFCNRAIQNFGSGRLARSAAYAMRYAAFVQHFSPRQIGQIFLDKYDAGYRWRSRFVSRSKPCDQTVVLLPSAYENVSRMAAAYARQFPEQSFLMVATRWSAKQFERPANVQVRDLTAYAGGAYPAAEAASLDDRWIKLRDDLCASAEFRQLVQAGILDAFPSWFRVELAVRNAWREVIAREPVCSVLCGDDSNTFTRLPVLLAAKRKIATIDFHHGAFDGRYLMKYLPCDIYLAKNEMECDYLLRVCGLPAEKVVIVPPPQLRIQTAIDIESNRDVSIVFFSEPYEAGGMRAEEVYRELLPRLTRVARVSGRKLIIKLHPFESREQRAKFVREVLSSEDAQFVTVVDGPLTQELLSRTWFGITIESTTVMDCSENGIHCFLCAWLGHRTYGYSDQYARFGVGEQLQRAEEIEEIPVRLASLTNPPARRSSSGIADAATLRRWLVPIARDRCEVRSAS
jgi:hypothetical protein